ncbi:hypothetical protein KBZ15_17955 [Cyanobium sp. BA20m-p-22]|nr:hypothetical protein [Cyanobium sp. BA20m-p-22]
MKKNFFAEALFAIASILNLALPSYGLYPLYIVPLCYTATNCNRFIAIILAIATSAITVSLALPTDNLANARIDIITVRTIMMLSVIFLYINYHKLFQYQEKELKLSNQCFQPAKSAVLFYALTISGEPSHN